MMIVLNVKMIEIISWCGNSDFNFNNNIIIYWGLNYG